MPSDQLGSKWMFPLPTLRYYDPLCRDPKTGHSKRGLPIFGNPESEDQVSRLVQRVDGGSFHKAVVSANPGGDCVQCFARPRCDSKS